MDKFRKPIVKTGPTARRLFLTTAAITLAALLMPVSTEAALFSSEPEPAVVVRPAQPKRLKPRRTGEKLSAAKEAAKPQGPLVIAVSIERQSVKVYDSNGLFAESPVSTGMRGHSTPMGVFSVIQKHKWHRSNIYSGAPMPYMQRVTWSGVAMHAGVLPGYPASHGCIRMPLAFAVKMWGWTRMGARVVITPGEIAPSEFTHPLLVFQKPAAAAVASAEPAKGSLTDGSTNRSQALQATAKTDKSSLSDAAGVKTADASGTMPSAARSPTLSDASQAAPVAEARTAEVKTEQAKQDETEPKAEKGIGSAPTIAETGALDLKPEPKDIAAAAEPPKDQARPSDAEKPVAAQANPEVKPEPKPDVAATPAPKRSGQLAALISRKDSKLYVRQNFAPLFETPVTIVASDRPLGTHVFTARADKDDARAFHWSVLSLPAVARRFDARAEDMRAGRRRKIASPIEVKTAPRPDSPTEALDRISIPDDAKARIAEALSTGGSLIVSDQGINAGETGEGTDFIMSLR